MLASLKKFVRTSPVLAPLAYPARRALLGWRRRAEERRYARRVAASWADRDRAAWLRSELEAIPGAPRFTLLLDASGGPRRLAATLNSVYQQVYPRWDLSLVGNVEGDFGYGPQSAGRMDQAPNYDEAVRRASGYIVFLDAGDCLSPLALAEAALALARDPGAGMIYSHEDTINTAGRHTRPVIKPGWSPDTLLTRHYTGRFAAYRTDLARQCSPLGSPPDEYALVLRAVELSERVIHLPQVLYSRAASRRAHPSLARSRAALENALRRRRIDARVEVAADGSAPELPAFRVLRRLKERPFISIIICTRDRAELLTGCLTSIFQRSTYPRFEVLVVDNGSTQPETARLLSDWASWQPERFRVLRLDQPFNFSALNNQAAEAAKGDLLLFLNNDVEVISPDWLEAMAAQAQRLDVGAVGAMLLYPDRTIQHAGIALRPGLVAVHAFHRRPEDDPGENGTLLGPFNVSAVTAACLMMRRQPFADLGGFDTRLAVSYGDVDLCLRLHQAGLWNLVLPQVRLFHRESATRGYERTPDQRARLAEETRLMTERWGRVLAHDPLDPTGLPGEADIAAPAPASPADPG